MFFFSHCLVLRTRAAPWDEMMDIPEENHRNEIQKCLLHWYAHEPVSGVRTAGASS